METMAWHFAVMPSIEFLGKNREMVDAPPTGQPSVTSIFIAKDQKLKDLSEPFRKRYKLGNDFWLVWNESRKLLIAHGTPITLWQVENESGYMRQPRQAAVTLSWYLGVEPGKAVPPDLKPLHRATIVGSSQQKTLFAWASPAPARLMSIDIESESTIGDDDQVVESDLLLDWNELVNGKTYSWRFNGSTILKNASASQSILAQVDSPIDGSWTLTIESSIVLTDGHPVAEGRLLESEGKEIASSKYPRFIATQERIKIQTSKGEILLQAFPALDLFHDATSSTENEVDPFSSNPSGSPFKEDGMQIASIPEELKPWFPAGLIDVKARMKAYGIHFPENGLAGFDLTSCHLFVADFDVGEMDKVEQLMMGGCRLRPHLVTDRKSVV